MAKRHKELSRNSYMETNYFVMDSKQPGSKLLPLSLSMTTATLAINGAEIIAEAGLTILDKVEA